MGSQSIPDLPLVPGLSPSAQFWTNQGGVDYRTTGAAIGALGLGPTGPAGTNGTPGAPGATGPTGPAGAGTPPIHVQSGTTYTFAQNDVLAFVNFTSGSAVTATIPTHATVAWANGSVLYFQQGGAGTVTIAGAGGVTINHVSATLGLSGQYAVGQAICTAQDVWTAFGAFA
jgi:hypothetical protein